MPDIGSGLQTIDFDSLTDQQRAIIEASPYLKDALLIGEDGRRVISKVTPTFSLNSIDNPVTPTSGRRYTASLGLAGLGGNTRYINPTLEGTWFLRQSSRTSLGLRAQAEYIRPFGDAMPLPIFERSCSAAGTVCAATTCAASDPGIRGAALSSAATRACSSTPST